MTEMQAQDLQEVVNWCTSNLNPLVNSGKSLKQLTQACIESTFPNGDANVKPDVIENYIKACLS